MPIPRRFRGPPAYLEARCMRTARVQLQSRWIGDHIYHPARAHADLRNDLMRANSSEDWYDTLTWIYGGADAAAHHRESLAWRTCHRCHFVS